MTRPRQFPLDLEAKPHIFLLNGRFWVTACIDGVIYVDQAFGGALGGILARGGKGWPSLEPPPSTYIDAPYKYH